MKNSLKTQISKKYISQKSYTRKIKLILRNKNIQNMIKEIKKR
jgi:hypothetical protein